MVTLAAFWIIREIRHLELSEVWIMGEWKSVWKIQRYLSCVFSRTWKGFKILASSVFVVKLVRNLKFYGNERVNAPKVLSSADTS